MKIGIGILVGLILVIIFIKTKRRDMIKGMITLNGAALAKQEVQFIDVTQKEISGVTWSEENGKFSFDNPGGNRDDIGILYKIRDVNLASIYYQHVTTKNPTVELNIDTSTFFDVTMEIISESGYPRFLTVFVDPVKFDDVPAELAVYFKMQDKKIASSYYYRRQFKEHLIKLKLRKGIYNIGGDYILPDSPVREENYIVKKILLNDGSVALNGDSYNGFRLQVNAKCSVKMILDRYKE
jgi:hypothetical protein